VSSIEFVDHAFINDAALEELIEQIKPWAMVKGKEYENTYNSENSVLEALGGKLIFSSGNSRYRFYSFLGRKAASVYF